MVPDLTHISGNGNGSDRLGLPLRFSVQVSVLLTWIWAPWFFLAAGREGHGFLCRDQKRSLCSGFSLYLSYFLSPVSSLLPNLPNRGSHNPPRDRTWLLAP